MASTQLADDVMSLVKGVHFPLVASALGGSLTRVAPGDVRLCRLAGAGRFAIEIEAYCFFTQSVLQLVVAAHLQLASCVRSARTARHALRSFTAVTVPRVLPVLRIGGASGDGSVRLREMPLVVACDSGLELV